jgi:prevent-host-death family protein
MKTVQLHEAKARLSELIDEATKGEEFVITRYGKPVARLVGESLPKARELGFHPIAFESDLAAPTDDDVLDLFDPAE